MIWTLVATGLFTGAVYAGVVTFKYAVELACEQEEE